jgi:hypothetical protein
MVSATKAVCVASSSIGDLAKNQQAQGVKLDCRERTFANRL